MEDFEIEIERRRADMILARIDERNKFEAELLKSVSADGQGEQSNADANEDSPFDADAWLAANIKPVAPVTVDDLFGGPEVPGDSAVADGVAAGNDSDSGNVIDCQRISDGMRQISPMEQRAIDAAMAKYGHV